MKVSVVIPAHNASQTLTITLNALRLQTFRDFEVVVVDDASTDATAWVAESYSDHLDLQVIRAPENLGRARARNLGIERAGGDILLLLDSDIEPVAEYVSKHLELHRRIPRAVGVGALRYPSYLSEKALAIYYASRGGARLDPGSPLPGKAFISCLASFPRTLIEKVGAFDPAFRVYGGEDLDLGLRFQKAGALLTYLPEAVGYHHHLRSLNEVMETLENYGEFGIPIIFNRHPEFAAQVKLDDLALGKFNLLRRLAASAPPYRLLRILTSLFQNRKLPAPLLTYLIYCAYRAGYRRSLRSPVQTEAPKRIA
jgi:glycosyltransferase involved in cell wall biosynthesis